MHNTTTLSGGEALAKSLVREGVEVMFSIPGIQIYGLVAGVRDEPNLRMITTRHEQATTYMADGYARVSGKPGVAMVIPGLGIYNAAAGLTTAYSRSSPVLLIAGQIPRDQIGRNLGGIHEILNQADVVRPITKWRHMVHRPREIPYAVSEAFRQMRTGRPRPVLVEIPPEVGVERDLVTLQSPVPISLTVPSRQQLLQAVKVITESNFPLIFAGGGVARSNAEKALVELAESTNIPVITSGGGKGVISDKHPLSYGSCISPSGERHELNQLFDVMQAADVVIGIGTRFSLGNPAGESSTLININVDDSELTRVQANTIPLNGDAKTTIEALLPLLKEAGADERSSPAAEVAAARRLISYYDIADKEPQYPILKMLEAAIPDETIIVWGVTQFGLYARTHYHVNHPKTYIDSGFSFNVGYSFPTALGAKIAEPDRPVVCVVGDGGFMFNASELSTAMKYGINVVTIVFRDNAYGNVARDMEEFFDGHYGTYLHNPDLVLFAESFGAVGMRAEVPTDLEKLIPQALELESPVIIDVPIMDIQLPRPKLLRHMSSMPWTLPQDGLIAPTR